MVETQARAREDVADTKTGAALTNGALTALAPRSSYSLGTLWKPSSATSI